MFQKLAVSEIFGLTHHSHHHASCGILRWASLGFEVKHDTNQGFEEPICDLLQLRHCSLGCAKPFQAEQGLVQELIFVLFSPFDTQYPMEQLGDLHHAAKR